MAKKKKNDIKGLKENESAATIQPITETLEKNYMPYAMSVIVSRALPEIDGFKPSHRKLLYTMYKMGLLKGQKTKSANIVGQTMQLNPHGDASIYETMVRLTKGNEALLHPFIDSKGSFGKHYSKDAYAASRYTEAKLDSICTELFSGIDKDAVDFVPNYDNTTTEPVLLPTTFPNILVSPNLGIAVGMACSICSFNLSEICDGTIAILKNPKTTVDRLLDIIKAPDFSGGAQIIYDREQMQKIYETGTGSIKMRSKYVYNKKENSIDIIEIPYPSCTDVIIKKVSEMIKAGKLKEVTDIRDSIDLNGGKLLTIDLKKDADYQIVMQKLFSATELENNFDCNFNILVDGTPMLLGIKEILTEWIKFRIKCVRRELTYELGKKEDKLHLLLGLAAILLDIDKAIRIIRNTEKEEDVVPNLASAFNLSKIQAEYIAEIKLRNLNRQYIINRVEEIENLRKDIEEINATLRDELKLKGKIIATLQDVKKKFGQPRKTELIEKEENEEPKKDLFFENYNCRLIMTKGGYFKKLSVQSARAADDHKLKDGDIVIYEEDTDNRGDVLFFTDKAQIYRARVCDFDLTKANQMGDYVPAKLNMDDGEHVVGCKMIYDINPEHHVVYIFENGKGLRVSMKNYLAKTRRRKITGACSSDSPLAGAVYEGDKPKQIFIKSEAGKGMLIKTSLIPTKATRTAGGVQILQFPRGKGKVDLVTEKIEVIGDEALKCRKLAIPSTGVALSQMTFNI